MATFGPQFIPVINRWRPKTGGLVYKRISWKTFRWALWRGGLSIQDRFHCIIMCLPHTHVVGREAEG